MQAFYRAEPLRFECTGCGACCSGGDDHHVFLAPGEARAIAGELGIGWAWFRRRYLTRTADGDQVLRMNASGSCVFLQDDGRCAVYAARPVQCRSYPFWPEILASRRAWRREAARCEGIDRGARVPLARIEAALRAVTGAGA